MTMWNNLRFSHLIVGVFSCVVSYSSLILYLQCFTCLIRSRNLFKQSLLKSLIVPECYTELLNIPPLRNSPQVQTGFTLTAGSAVSVKSCQRFYCTFPSPPPFCRWWTGLITQPLKSIPIQHPARRKTFNEQEAALVQNESGAITGTA